MTHIVINLYLPSGRHLYLELNPAQTEENQDILHTFLSKGLVITSFIIGTINMNPDHKTYHDQSSLTTLSCDQ